MAAKRRRAPAARAGQSQLFPEALQDQRQLTMGSMLPAESARVSAAESARQSRLVFGELLPPTMVGRYLAAALARDRKR